MTSRDALVLKVADINVVSVIVHAPSATVRSLGDGLDGLSLEDDWTVYFTPGKEEGKD